MPKLNAWLFDAYPDEGGPARNALPKARGTTALPGGGMRVWAIDEAGRAHSFLDPWRSAFFARGTPAQIDAIRAFVGAKPDASCRFVEKRDLFSGESSSMLEISCPPLRRDKLAAEIQQFGAVLFDSDVHIAQCYHYDRGHFPLARGVFEIEDGVLVNFELRDDPWAIDYALPPLKIMELTLAGSDIVGKLDPNHGLRGKLVVTMDGESRELDGSVDDQLESLARRIRDWDPDVIETDWGDTVLMPLLDDMARKRGVELGFSRDPARSMARRPEKSFMTYGRMIYQGGARYLFGRWHLDRKNSFMMRETDKAGLYEIARVARIPVQRAARCTIGTSLSSMQMRWARANDYLIPLDKAQAEDFRPATDLLVADKGGLVFSPDAGWHDNVVEFDFTSMYPEMMVQHNISPETVNCACCPDNLVPEIGHNLCRKRRGLVAEVLAPILIKRAAYKKLAKAGGPEADVYKLRATAFKWCLVCCFGYLGFKNARFGKIEAHECVTAWGRETLLRAKEAAERRGFRLLHALVDSLWLVGRPDMDLEELRRGIEKEAGCPLALEGVYKWIRFSASREDSQIGVPNRYFGVFQNGEIKIRGIASRRHDTPPLLKELQSELLAILARCANLSERRAAIPQLLAVVDDYRARLKDGGVTAAELAISFNLSKAPEEYVHDTASAIAAKKLAASGVKLHPGELVRYVITSAKDRVKEWRATPLALMENGLEYDAQRYREMLDRAASELLDGLTPIETTCSESIDLRRRKRVRHRPSSEKMTDDKP